MRFSLSKINQLLNTKLTLSEATSAFNRLGFEVEDTYQLSPVISDTLVVGKIIKIEKHANAERLNVCQVTIGNEVIKQIICGAPNVKLNANVIVALAGTDLGEVIIKISEIRGIKSEGMLCSLSELGIDPKVIADSQESGIFLFQAPDSRLGSSALEYLGFNDQFIELAILNDRSDMHSLFNVATELGATLNKKLHKISFAKPLVATFANTTKVTIKHPDYYAYSNLIINDYHQIDSPWWLVQYLMGINVKPQNLLTDLANYVNNLTSNPIDILDADKITDFNLKIVKENKEQQLDLEYNLLNKTFSKKVVLRNKEKTLAIGSSINNLAFVCDENSHKLLISSSSYSNLIARQYIKEFNNLVPNLNQHAKGSNPVSIPESLALFSNLLAEIVNDIKVSDIKTFNYQENNLRKFRLSIKKLDDYLGYKQDWSEAIQHLTRLGFDIKRADPYFIITIPSYRRDIELDVNLIAEFIRTLNYDNIRTIAPISNEEPTYPNARFHWEQELTQLLKAQNCFNTKTYSLVHNDHHNDFDIFNYQNPIKIKDPLSSSHETLRLSLIGSLFSALEYNANNYRKDINLFEISNVFYNNRKWTRQLGLVINGDIASSPLFDKLSLSNDFYVVKGLVDSIIKTLGIEDVSYQPLVDHPHFHPGTSAKIVINKQVVGCIGKAHPQFYNKFNAMIVILDLDLLFKNKKAIYIKNLSKLANVARDLSFVVPTSLNADQLIAAFKATPKVTFADVEIFDIYVDDKLKSQQKKVLSVKYWIKQKTKTLTKNGLEKIMDNIIKHVTNSLDAKIRN